MQREDQIRELVQQLQQRPEWRDRPWWEVDAHARLLLAEVPEDDPRESPRLPPHRSDPGEEKKKPPVPSLEAGGQLQRVG